LPNGTIPEAVTMPNSTRPLSRSRKGFRSCRVVDMSLPQVSGEKLLEDKSGASTRGNSSSDSVY